MQKNNALYLYSGANFAERPVFRLRSLSCSREFAANCFPLPVRGIGRILCKRMIYCLFSSFCTGRATKKGASKKGSFVRIKVLLHICKLMYVSDLRCFFSAYSRIAYRLFAWSCVRLPVSPVPPPYLLAWQYKYSDLRRIIQMRRLLEGVWLQVVWFESDDAIRIIFFDRCPIFSDVKVNFRYLFMWFGFHIFVLPNFKLFLLWNWKCIFWCLL